MTSLIGDVEHINRSDSSGQKRLVGISPRCIHDETSRVLADSLGEGSWALLDNNISPALGGWYSGIDSCAICKFDFWHDDGAFKFGFADLALDLTAINCEISEIRKQFLGTILTSNEREQFGTRNSKVSQVLCSQQGQDLRVIDESRPAIAVNEGRMGKKRS
jgi:hypothetical protein